MSFFVENTDQRGYAVRQTAEIGDFTLQSGKTIRDARVGYCVYSSSPDNPVVLVVPALTGSARAVLPLSTVGESQGDGWWSRCIGPRKLIDTSEFTTVCVDHLGGPATKDGGETTSAEALCAQGISPDELTSRDEVELLSRFFENAGVTTLRAVIGGSMGGGIIYEWLFQDRLHIEHLVDISGCGFISARSRDFFQIQIDLLLERFHGSPRLSERLREDIADLGRASPIFDAVREHLIFELRQAERGHLDEHERLGLARKIGFLRFVTPRYFDEKAQDLGFEIGSREAERAVLEWLEERADSFVHRFSTPALAGLCSMIVNTERRSPQTIAARLLERQTRLTGFFVRGDILFPAELQSGFYHEISEELPGDAQDLSFVHCTSDPVRGHDHFLSPAFPVSAACIKARLEGLTVHALALPEHLGAPLPLDSDANSVALPLWNDVIGYEEKHPRVTALVRTGYPRFVTHPDVRRLITDAARKYAAPDEVVAVLPTGRSATQCLEFLTSQGVEGARIAPYGRNHLYCCIAPRAAEPLLRAYWQHSGEIVSSRLARATLSDRSEQPERHTKAYHAVRAQVAALSGVSDQDVLLFPTGMAAITHAVRIVRHLSPSRPSLQLGFPYIDSVKVQEKLGAGCTVLADAVDECHDRVAKEVQSSSVSAIFTETPGNPLLYTPDLGRLRDVLDGTGLPLVVDDTLGAFINLDVRPFADMTVTSLTKFFTGQGRAMGGSLWINPAGARYAELRDIAQRLYDDSCWWEDLECLVRDHTGTPEWISGANDSAEALADFLASHDKVAAVYYPKFKNRREYDLLRRPQGGFGTMFSLDLTGGEPAAARFYDMLKVNKGPSLGLRFTLACPYTLLAHYNELDWAEDHGVARHLVRVSVGTERKEDLLQRFDEALAAV